ncbi:hypothetical protein [Streptomyces phage phiSAJS1]|uniref:hypothetical protein n=1 Tax=Streptomyces phage phiSAJS1 TaxID=1755682 RepID=UPI000721819E|nr:hypothetical protein AVT91_p40 [Streptomyces phage phiSAJS1]ALO79379.1 hypothetical protein [Streptomyces phage phiSAJS1]
MKATVRLLVAVRVDGDYYTDADDLAAHVDGWIQGALDDRDDIDAYGDGLSITRVLDQEPKPGGQGKPGSSHIRALYPAERKYLLDAARGYTAAQTAKRHLVSKNTVDTSLKRAKAALGARNITHAVSLALDTGEFTTKDLKEGTD